MPVPLTHTDWCQQLVSTFIAWIAVGAMRCTVPSAPVIEMLRPAEPSCPHHAPVPVCTRASVPVPVLEEENP